MGSFFERIPYTNFHELNLDWMLAEMKRTAEKVYGLLDDVESIVQAAENRIDAKVEAKIAEIMGEIQAVIQAFQDRINAQIEENLRKMQELEGKVDTAVGEVDEKLRAQAIENEARLLRFQLEINEQIQVLKDEIRRYDVELKRYIEQRFEELIDMIPDVTMVWIHNPINGTVGPVEDVIEWCNNFWLEFGMPVEMFDWLGFKVEEFDAEVWNFDTRFKEMFMAPGMAGADKVHHGRTSVWESIQEVERRTVPFGVKVEEFDAIGVAVDDVDYTVDRFDMWGLWRKPTADEEVIGYDGELQINRGRTGTTVCGFVNAKAGAGEKGPWRLLAKLGKSNYRDGYTKEVFAGKRTLTDYICNIMCAADGNFQTIPVTTPVELEYKCAVVADDKWLWIAIDKETQQETLPVSFFWEYAS